MRGCQCHHRHIGGNIGDPCGVQSNCGVRIDYLAAFFMGPAHRSRHFVGVGARAGKKGRAFAHVRAQHHFAHLFKPFHPRARGRSVAAFKVKQQPFKITRHLNIHRWRSRWRHTQHRIIPLG